MEKWSFVCVNAWNQISWWSGRAKQVWFSHCLYSKISRICHPIGQFDQSRSTCMSEIHGENGFYHVNMHPLREHHNCHYTLKLWFFITCFLFLTLGAQIFFIHVNKLILCTKHWRVPTTWHDTNLVDAQYMSHFVKSNWEFGIKQFSLALLGQKLFL